jgi:hypothetical protein
MFPCYYQRGPICIKRETSTSGKQINIDVNHRHEAFQSIDVTDRKVFDEMIADMSIVSFEVYERYLIHLHKRSQHEAKTFRDTHQKSPEFFSSEPPRFFEEQ